MEILATIQSIWTVVVFLIFVGIVFWAWSGKNKTRFQDAAQIPLNDGINVKPDIKSENKEAGEKENLNG